MLHLADMALDEELIRAISQLTADTEPQHLLRRFEALLSEVISSFGANQADPDSFNGDAPDWKECFPPELLERVDGEMEKIKNNTGKKIRTLHKRHQVRPCQAIGDLGLDAFASERFMQHVLDIASFAT